MSRRDAIMLAAMVLLYAVAGTVALLLDDATDRQTLIVYATGAAVIWYSWETVRLRITATRQLEQQIRPFIIVEQAGNPFKVKNIGAGPALNMRIPPAEVQTHGADGVDLVMHFEPEVTPHVPPGGVVNLDVRPYVNGQRQGELLAAHVQSEVATFTTPIEIVYENLEGRRYAVRHDIVPGAIRLHGLGTA